VSTPFRWEEIEEIEPRLFTMETIFERIGEVGDPFSPVATSTGQSVAAALQELGAFRGSRDAS
jgi:DNA primase